MTHPSTQKVAFITGGNRGLGLETAFQLGKLGINVVVGVRSESAGAAATVELGRRGVVVSSIVFDAKSAIDRQRAYAHFESTVGKLDILVNNAGVYLEGKPGEDLYAPSTVPESVLRETMDVNFFAPVALTQKMLPLLLRSEAGRIVNLSSVLGSLSLHSDPTSPIYGVMAVAYNTSKTALNSFTVHMAKELRDTPVKINSAHPGWVHTDMGGDAAPMSIVDGAMTSVMLATLSKDGPTGGFLHLGETVPW